MRRRNDEVAVALHELADLLELAGADRYRILGYRRGADAVQGLAADVSTLSEAQLTAVRGIGRGVASKVRELLDTGTIKAVEELRTDIPPGVADLSYLPGLRTERRVLLHRALEVAERMVAELRAHPAVLRCEYAGSLRRMRETIGDIDLLVAAEAPDEVMEAFGLQADLRVVPPESYGAALQYFTGSQAHNVKVREHAVRQGWTLSEYGLFEAETRERLAGASEEEVYERLGMQWIPPALREDHGEVEAALADELPTLVEEKDLRGDLQSHSDYSDGRVPLEEMVRKAIERGYEYYAVTDHGRDLTFLRNLSLEAIERQRAEVAELNRRYGDRITVLHGVELNISADGGLDYPDDVLAGFDICVASIHHQMRQPAEQMTRRLLRAIENPHVNVIGHPTGRRLGRREPYEFDLAAVAKAAARNQVALEINSSPERLDLRDDMVRWAREHGPYFAISTDGHSPRELDFMHFGIAMAQRGWVSAAEVVNTWPLERLRRFIAKERD